ncbi:MAG: cupin-like domain-containing protein [Erythrobacter sp.]|nr:MAG: cupin-like domain-containing protein [Erythrobacter sp.]
MVIAVEQQDGRLPSGAGWEATVAEAKPLLFKGAASNWELVEAGRKSAKSAADLLRRYSNGGPVTVYRGDAAMRGRFHYNDALDGFNFTGTREPLAQVLDDLLAGSDPVYVGSTDIGLYFPGFTAANGFDLAAIHPMLVEQPGLASLWIGNRTTASAHYDYSHNIAVCAVGQRRFTLFPPDQVANLYPGPLEPTPAGQVVSMVDLAAPDLDRFPRFAEALENAQVAEMEPGDVLIYPAMWWHCVEALAPFNVLVNYWWNSVPAHIDSPQTTLLHGLLSLRERPEQERQAWRALFDYYLFGDPDLPRAHLPEHAQGPLAPLDPGAARRLRAQVLRKLQR